MALQQITWSANVECLLVLMSFLCRRRGHLYLFIGFGLSLEVPTCCLEANRVLYSSYPSMIPIFLQATLHFPSHLSLAVSSLALLLKCHLELKGPGVASSVKDICTDMLTYFIHPFPLSLKGPESSLSTTIFQNIFLITICLREPSKPICTSTSLGFCHLLCKLPNS